MNCKFSVLLIVMLLILIDLKAQKAIIVEGVVPSGYNDDSIEIMVSNADYSGKVPEFKVFKQKIENGFVKWVFISDSPLILNSEPFFESRSIHIIEPGDSIHVTHVENNLLYTGIGSDKFTLVQKASMLYRSFGIWSRQKKIESLADYLEYSKRVDEQIKSSLLLLDQYTSKIAPYIFGRIKANLISSLEFDRINNFYVLAANATDFGLAKDDVEMVMDSTLNKSAALWLRSVNFMMDDVDYLYMYINVEILIRKYGFDLTHDSINSASKRRMAYYNYTKTGFKGVVREKVLTYILTSQGINQVGFTPQIESMLADYYLSPGFENFKSWVQKYEKKARILEVGKSAPEFSLMDIRGKKVTKNDLKGKIVLMYFWSSYCTECRWSQRVLEKVKAFFKNDSGVVIVSISTDKDKDIWLKNVEQQNYTNREYINLFTNGGQVRQWIMKAYNLDVLPRTFLLDANGDIVHSSMPAANANNSKRLIELIREQLALAYDGPYVIYSDSCKSAYSITPSGILEKTFNLKSPISSLKVQTDQLGKNFELALKSNLLPEPSEFDSPNKLLVISDIEGNFKAFKNLLLSGYVIDENYNWTFGSGHLVIVGDVFDRGYQVTECLWLIYALEEKAKAKGGYVHFILGNHEIMNLNGKLGYLQKKYLDNSKRLTKNYNLLYSERSELGRLLLTNNIIEKIGNILFVHVGISKDVAALPLAISQINTLARQYYSRDAFARKAENYSIKTLFNSKTSPFWYRRYYQDEEIKVYSNGDTICKPSLQDIDRILEKFRVSKIITGHTIIADTISQHYNGKVINVDTKHAEGKSEALLILNDRYYRVSKKGLMKFEIVEDSGVSHRIVVK